MPSDNRDGIRSQNEILTNRVISLEVELAATNRLNLQYRYQIGLLVKLLGNTIDERNRYQRGVKDGK